MQFENVYSERSCHRGRKGCAMCNLMSRMIEGIKQASIKSTASIVLHTSAVVSILFFWPNWRLDFFKMFCAAWERYYGLSGLRTGRVNVMLLLLLLPQTHSNYCSRKSLWKIEDFLEKSKCTDWLNCIAGRSPSSRTTATQGSNSHDLRQGNSMLNHMAHFVNLKWPNLQYWGDLVVYWTSI